MNTLVTEIIDISVTNIKLCAIQMTGMDVLGHVTSMYGDVWTRSPQSDKNYLVLRICSPT